MNIENRASVYLVSCCGKYKIGYSQNVTKRINQLAASLPEKPKWLAEVEVYDPQKCEAQLHRSFSEYHIYREWFDLEKWRQDLIHNNKTALEHLFINMAQHWAVPDKILEAEAKAEMEASNE